MGVPVLTSNWGAMQEMGGGHAILCDTQAAENIANALSKALLWPHEEYEERVRAAQLYAQEFSWKKAASQTLGVYRMV